MECLDRSKIYFLTRLHLISKSFVGKAVTCASHCKFARDALVALSRVAMLHKKFT